MVHRNRANFGAFFSTRQAILVRRTILASTVVSLHRKKYSVTTSVVFPLSPKRWPRRSAGPPMLDLLQCQCAPGVPAPTPTTMAETTATTGAVRKAQHWLVPAFFVVLWSSGFIVAKFGLPYAPPLTFLLLRCT